MNITEGTLAVFARGRITIAVLLAILFIPLSTICQPTAQQVASNMTVGWNLGNSLEVPGNETGWGNPATTQQLIDAVASAGFNTLRIPCAWDSYANQSTLQIDPTWLARVKEVVDYGVSNNMYIILNSHWDNGWLEEHPFYANQAAVNIKQDAYWTQIANYFQSYDEHLLFAGTNEVRADYGTPTSEYIEVQESYNQTFVDAVRATGGNNSNRILIVQTYNTNAWHGLDYFTLPNDPTNDRLMVEVHYYDPYSFTLDGSSGIYTWAQASWGKEDYVDDLFNQMYNEWPAQGIPVILGEFGVMRRTSLSGSAYTDHINSREYWLEYITNASVSNGMVPVYWDNGYNGDGGFALFDRSSGSTLDQGAIDALLEGAGVGDTGETYTLTTNTSGSGTVTTSQNGPYDAGTSVTLTATPSNGWVFSSWSGDASGSSNPLTITVNQNLNITATFTQQSGGGSGQGAILREYWSGISGNAISSLTGAQNYPGNPSGSELLSSLEGPVNSDNNYGTRIRGYLHPPTSGTYTLWIAGDDNCELYLSTDNSQGNSNLIASVSGWTSSRQWDKYSSQEAQVTLTGGETYYIEVLHKEGSGGDNIAVAWQGPGISQAVIDGSYLSPYDPTSGGGGEPDTYTISTTTTGNGNISLSPSGNTYEEGSQVTATATAGSGWSFAGWNGDINGSNNSVTFTITSNMSIGATFTENPTGGGSTCSNPTTIALPFSQDGAGNYCWVTSTPITYINSWGVDELLINGVDYTNQWSNSMPAAVNGEWVIQFSGSAGWAHFEAHSSAGRTTSTIHEGTELTDIKAYPNPFEGSFRITGLDNQQISSVAIKDLSGKTIRTISYALGNNQNFGQNLSPGVYLLHISDGKTEIIQKLIKR